MKRSYPLSVLAFFSSVLMVCIPTSNGQTSNPPEFYSQVLPILQANCIACHNLQKSEGGLNLENFEAASKGGDSGALFVPGKSNDSSLIKRVKGEEELMPPAGNTVGAKVLTPEQIQLLAAWVDFGAIPGTKINKQNMQWQALPDSVRPIYAVDSTSDGQFTAIGRGNQAMVYRWAMLGSTDVVSLEDPTLTSIHGRPTAHHDLVQSIAISPDAKHIATGGYRDIKIWKRTLGPIDDALTAKLSGSKRIELSPNGQMICRCTSTPSIEVIDANTSDLLYRIDQPQAIASFGWSADSTKIGVSTQDGTLQLLSLPTEPSTRPAPLEVGLSQSLGTAFQEIAWLGSQAVVGRLTDNKLQVWKFVPATDQPAKFERLPILEGLVNATCMACFGETKIAVGVAGGSLVLANYQDGTTLISIPTADPIRVFWSADGSRVLCVGSDGILRAWNSADGKLIWENQLDGDASRSIMTAETGLARQKARVDRATVKLPEYEKAKTAEMDNRAKVMKSRDEAAEALAKKMAELDTAKQVVTDSEAAMTAATQALEQAKKNLEQSQKDVEMKKQQLMAIEKSKIEAEMKLTTLNNTLAAADESINKAAAALAEFQSQLENEKATLAATEQKANEVKSASKPIRAHQAAISADRRTIVTSHDGGRIRVVCAENGQTEQSLSGGLEGTGTIAISNAGRVIQTHDDGRVASWQVTNQWNLVRTVGTAEESPLSDRVTAMAFTNDGLSLIAGSGPPSRFGELKMISLEDGSVTRDWGQVHSDTILAIKLSPDGKTIATSGADKLVRLHSFAPETKTRTFEGHTHHVLGLAWHDDGFLLASSSADNSIKIWDVEAGQATRTITGFGKEVTSLSFVGRTNQLLSSAADNQLRLHDVTNGSHLRTFGGPGDSMYSLAVVSPTGTDSTWLVLSGGQEGVLWIWKVADAAVVKQLK